MSETRRPTNIKRAARELQAQNPGMSYTEARAKVVAAAATTTPACASCGHTTPHDTAGIGVCRTPDCGCDGPVNGFAADFTNKPASSAFAGLITETTVVISASHVSPQEWAMLAAGPLSTWAFRSMPDPETDGMTVQSIMVRCNADDLDCEEDGPTQVSEQFPTLLTVLRWAADGGAGWVYLDVDETVVQGLPTPGDGDAPARMTESEAMSAMYQYRSQFGWAGTFFTRRDAEVYRPLTAYEWASLRDTYEWRKGLSESLTERGWADVEQAVLDVIGTPADPDADLPGTAMRAAESEALRAWHTFQQQFGWAGSMFMRGDAESIAHRALTEAEWEAVQDNYYWNRAVADGMAEMGNELIESALSEIGVVTEDDDEDEDDY